MSRFDSIRFLIAILVWSVFVNPVQSQDSAITDTDTHIEHAIKLMEKREFVSALNSLETAQKAIVLRLSDNPNEADLRRIKLVTRLSSICDHLGRIHEFGWNANSILGEGAREAIYRNSVGATMVLVPSGEFMMGSSESSDQIRQIFGESADFADEHPQHKVRITKSFYMSATEVTVGQFARFVKDTGYVTDVERDGRGGAGFNPNANEATGNVEFKTWETAYRENDIQGSVDGYPVVFVSWNDAFAFCQWLSRKEHVRYRLPTEAEWEYAARAGTRTRYWTGDDPESLIGAANVPDASFARAYSNPVGYPTLRGDDHFVSQAPVGQFKPNPFGFYDMLGNVFEWCHDSYDKAFYSRRVAEDPFSPPSHLRVIRGGCYM